MGADKKACIALNQCGNEPDFYPFYILRLKLEDAQSQQATSDIEQVLKLAGNDWRPGLFTSKFYFEKGNTQRDEEIAQTFYRKHPQNYYIGLQYAKMPEMNKKYADCVNILKSIQVIPNERATDGQTIWRNANLGNALEFMKAKKYRKALLSISMSREWPINLGVGKPYQVDERLEDFVAMQCYLKLKDSCSARELSEKIVGHKNLSGDFNDFLTAWLLKSMGNETEAEKIMNELLIKNPSSNIIQWCKAIFMGDHSQIENIDKDTSYNNQSFFFIQKLFNKFIDW